MSQVQMLIYAMCYASNMKGQRSSYVLKQIVLTKVVDEHDTIKGKYLCRLNAHAQVWNCADKHTNTCFQEVIYKI